MHSLLGIRLSLWSPSWRFEATATQQQLTLATWDLAYENVESFVSHLPGSGFLPNTCFQAHKYAPSDARARKKLFSLVQAGRKDPYGNPQRQTNPDWEKQTLEWWHLFVSGTELYRYHPQTSSQPYKGSKLPHLTMSNLRFREGESHT